ncbi:hypothetical protein BX600DRAFT_476301 [Xylariales sp. PMI_506]|nr:hypothetical protein BX600DRAFT_476301 [Xylariales sp. PMI_506]
MDTTHKHTSRRGGADTRSSLACLPCRSRHLKCDGGRPQCARCADMGKDCQYAASRRGGLDRAALAERRTRLAAAQGVQSTDSHPVQAGSCLPVVVAAGEQDQSRVQSCVIPEPASIDVSYGFVDTVGFEDRDLATAPSLSPIPPLEEIEDDPYFETYYKTFHTFHPVVLPREYMINACRDRGRQSGLRPLIATLRVIGHLYEAKEWSTPLQEALQDCLLQSQPRDPITVQCRLLYSIALFWYGEQDKSKQEMEAAIPLAVDLGMFRRDFAAEHGNGDPVLAESWRRTWWMLYLVEAFYAGTLGTMNFACMDIETTVDLPCEEHEYQSGRIPQGKTLQDFDCREFDDTIFSSFAYLIGAVRCAASAITSSPKVPNKQASTQIIQAADSMLDGWLLLLPEKEKPVMKKNGDIDELMFQAHLLIHVATIGMHRPMSDLKFNAVEDLSSCARSPPPNTPTPELINVHTTRVLRSIQAQIRLLALPARPFSHTPFVTCMVSEGTLALLSACRFLLTGKELAVARDQIRLTIGCLRALGETWPRTARNVREIQMIARHALGLNASSGSGGSTPSIGDVPRLSGGEAQSSSGGSTSQSSGSDIFSSIDGLNTVCGWYNFGDLGLEEEPSWMTE